MKGLTASEIHYIDPLGNSVHNGTLNGSFLLALNEGRTSGMSGVNLLHWISDTENINGGYPLLSNAATMPSVLSFDTLGGSPVAALTNFDGDSILSSPVTTKPGFSFDGWYTEATEGVLIEFPYTPSYRDLLFARWSQEVSKEDASLSSLSASEIELNPTFDSSILTYISNVSNTVTNTRITAKPTNNLSVISINGVIGTSEVLDLAVGKNTITILVTAEDQVTRQTYTITINRASRPSYGGGGGSSSSNADVFTISTNAGEGGSIDPTKKVNIGEKIKFNIKPNIGYDIEDVKVDGKSVGAVSYYEFTKVNENHTISATFKKIKESKPDTDQKSLRVRALVCLIL